MLPSSPSGLFGGRELGLLQNALDTSDASMGELAQILRALAQKGRQPPVFR